MSQSVRLFRHLSVDGMPGSGLLGRLRAVPETQAVLLEVRRVALRMPSASERQTMKDIKSLLVERRLPVYAVVLNGALASRLFRTMLRQAASRSDGSILNPQRVYASVEEAKTALQRDGWLAAPADG